LQGIILFSMSVMLAYALFSDEIQAEVTLESKSKHKHQNKVIVNDSSGRHVTMSCQTCRKLKNHKEVEPNLYQCTK
jgi:cytochrome c2